MTTASRLETEDEATELFLGIGLTEETAKNSLKNKKFRDNLKDIIKEAGAEHGCCKATGALLYETASKYPKNALEHRQAFLQEYIITGKIKNKDQLTGGVEYLSKLGNEKPDWVAFKAASGIGIEVTPEEISAVVAEAIEAEKDRVLEDRYRSKGVLLGIVRPKVRWANVEAIKSELHKQLEALLGPVSEEDLKEPEKKKKKSAKPKAAPPAASATADKEAVEDVKEWLSSNPWAHLSKPVDNIQVHTTVSFSDGHQMHISNTPERLKEHLEITGAQVRTRFPPEPNGYLHIGHAKAMHVSFGMAAEYGGVCFLRYDDTNPEAEKQEYIDHIQDIVSWLGWKPWKVTYSSDYFQELYDLAVKLIKTGNAYVCHQTADEISRARDERTPSPWRDRPVEESLRLFNSMRMGLLREGEATLRMKQDVKNENYNMFDLIAYRIKYIPHPKAGWKWCIYPSYDYTHCIVDSLEHITHSLCTLEFESRRASYFWLLKVLDLYMPIVWEYGRLNLTHNVLSKRKLNKLATGGYVDGWDDPRLLTLAGLRRRGVTPRAINSFCREVGITRSDTAMHLHKLDHHIRADLEASSPRLLAVLRPLHITLTNLPADYHRSVNADVFPNDKSNSETYEAPLSRDIWIEDTDFQETDSKGYYGLAPNKSVMLRYAGYITCTGFQKHEGTVTHVEATFEDLDNRKPPKGVLSWVGRPQPGQEAVSFEARLYDTLFKGPEPTKLGDDWIEDLNPASRIVLPAALASPPLAAAKAGDRFQLERLGYFCVDPASSAGHLILNRTVTLKEGTAKTTVATKVANAVKAMVVEAKAAVAAV